MEIYHGTNVVVSQPEIREVGFAKDFGYGFYCTKLERQAQRWAASKRNPHIVCVYELGDLSALNVKVFAEMSDEWLDFVVNCRHGITHSYDIVEGPMADDQIWDFVEDFMEGRISRSAFWELVKFKYPTHQIVFCNDKALQILTFKRSYSL